jgi:hypothetical protein
MRNAGGLLVNAARLNPGHLGIDKAHAIIDALAGRLDTEPRCH